MLYRGILASDLSGSLDGIVWSHNRGGPYARNRTIPTNPATPEQDAIRSALSSCKTLWDALTNAQRLAWAAYSRSAPRTNRIGSPRPAGGWPEFFRANSIRLQVNNLLGSGLDPTNDPPSTPTGGPATDVAAEITNLTAGKLAFTWPDTNPWVGIGDQSGLALWLSDHLPQTINFFDTPYTLRVYANGTDNPTGATVTVRTGQAPIPTGRRIFWRVRSTFADGRLGLPATGHVDS